MLESGRFIFGPEVEAFEAEAAAYLGVPHAIGVANGTDAIVLSLEAMGIGTAGNGTADEVICPSFTFYATAEAIVRAGATPVFADIDPVSLNLDPDDVERRITPKTKAIMPVHLFGRPAPLAELAAFGLPLIEDAAQAFGAEGIAHHRRLLDLQLLPDQEPVRARRRRSCCLHRRRDGRAAPDAPLPRLARQAHVRADRDELAARRAAGRVPPHLAPAPRRLERVAARGCGAVRRARSRRRRRAARRRCRPRLPHVRRPHARARPDLGRARGARDRLGRVLRDAAPSPAGAALPGLGARLAAGDGEGRRREPGAAALGRDRRARCRSASSQTVLDAAGVAAKA